MKMFIAFVVGALVVAYNPELGDTFVDFTNNLMAFGEGVVNGS